MPQVSPVQAGAEAMAQLLALNFSKMTEQATDVAKLNLLITNSPESVGGSPQGVGQLLDLMA